MKFKSTFPAHPRNLQQISVSEFAIWPAQLSNNDWVWLEFYTAIYEWQVPSNWVMNPHLEPSWVLIARTQ